MPAVAAEALPLPFEQSLFAVFQPIASLAGSVATPVALEALARGPDGSPYALPREMFAVARAHRLVERLDLLCISAALAAAPAVPPHLGLFLNVHAQTLHHSLGFPAFLVNEARRHGIEPSRLTLEIIEHARLALHDADAIAVLQRLRGLGIRVAVDDVADMGEARRACVLMPDYFKLDASLVRESRDCDVTRGILHAVIAQAGRAGARVIAEGVETAQDAALVAEAGVTLVQGWLAGEPREAGM